MPLAGTDAVLAESIKALMLADPAIGAVDGAALDGLCSAIATAVVAHIVANAQVVPTALIAPTGGGPVTGVGAIA